MTATPGLTASAPHPYRLSLVSAKGCAAWLAGQSEPVQRWLRAQGFTGAAGSHALLPGSDCPASQAAQPFALNSERR